MAEISDKTTEWQKLGRIGEKPVGIAGIASIMAYLIIFSVVLLYSIITFWPGPSHANRPNHNPANLEKANETNTDPATTEKTNGANNKQQNSNEKNGGSSERLISFLFFSPFLISDEMSTVLIITLSGALGSLVHALRSFYKYVGNRELVWSWLSMYVMLPFIGATLGLLFYLIIRGGFFPQAGTEEISPFGFMAMAALSGLFSEQAILKLKEVSETLLAKPEKGKDRLTKKQGDDAPEEKQEEAKGETQ